MDDPDALRVLVVDDHLDSADSLSHLLEALGCQAVPAYDAASALKASGQLLPHVVFLDLNLGQENGCQVLSALRWTFPRGHEPIVVCLTGHGDPQTEAHCRQAGFELFLMKPISLDLLRGVLDRARERVAAQRASTLHAA
jgi:CheY-like chemotaxis protein